MQALWMCPTTGSIPEAKGNNDLCLSQMPTCLSMCSRHIFRWYYCGKQLISKVLPCTVDISQCGWKIKDVSISPSYIPSLQVPPDLTDVLVCGCKTVGKASSSMDCSNCCHRSQSSCSVYCMCRGTEQCLDPLLIRTIDDNDVDAIDDYERNESDYCEDELDRC